MTKEKTKFYLNEKLVEANADETIWQVANRLGTEIPHLCYSDKPGYRADGNCRACMVEIEGERVLAASCIRKPTDSMKVKTSSDKAKKSRELVFELLLADQPKKEIAHDNNSDFWKWIDKVEVKESRFPKKTSCQADVSHPSMAVNLDACIQCNLCVRACREVQVNDVIGMAYRGENSKIVFDFDDTMGDSTCVACGECVQACPTGAYMPASIVDKDGVGHSKVDKKIDIVCPYCGVGCQIEYNVNDNKINAFVAKGQKIFLTTGLLRQSKNAEQVIGVIAHEIGHIAGGHLIRMNNQMKKARSTAFISQIMGLALSALAKDPTPVVAITSGGKNLASRSFLNFTRGQEQAADQAAAKYLDIIGVSGKGLLELLNVLAGQEFLQSSNQDPYVRSHPSIQSRIRFMKNHIRSSSSSDKKLPINIAKKQLRLVAKLDAFIEEPGFTLAKYSDNDKSTAALYARAIAMFRNANLNSALPIINTLIDAHKTDLYIIHI